MLSCKLLSTAAAFTFCDVNHQCQDLLLACQRGALLLLLFQSIREDRYYYCPVNVTERVPPFTALSEYQRGALLFTALSEHQRGALLFTALSEY
jgi:hypothetical protein